MGKPDRWHKLRKLDRNQSLVEYQQNHSEARLHEIGKVFNISKQRVSTILKKVER